MRRLHTDERRNRTATARLPAVLAPRPYLEAEALTTRAASRIRNNFADHSRRGVTDSRRTPSSIRSSLSFDYGQHGNPVHSPKRCLGFSGRDARDIVRGLPTPAMSAEETR
jgi:hypothetical protein